MFLTGICLFGFGYLLNMFYITVLYHRGITHQAVILRPGVIKLLQATGIWVTGLDPKAWAVMHRLHHLHSDQVGDPHSPAQLGVWGVWGGQYRAYKHIIQKLIDKSDLEVNFVSKDIPLELSFLSFRGMSNYPYYLHALLGLLLWFFSGSFFLGLAYVLGIISHPVQGWMVNSLAHTYGKRNFETPDSSKNNFWVALLVFGEGLQNNHHAHPQRAKFSFKPTEIDLGHFLCIIAEKLGMLKIRPF
jgi:stearoyl-CoA desaturase (delta-9 desaturase)